MSRINNDLFEVNPIRTFSGLAANLVKGYIGSWCDPLTIKKLKAEFDEATLKTLSTYDLAQTSARALGYVAGIGSHIERIANNPDDIKSYILPIATNLAGLAIGKFLSGKVTKRY